MNAEPEFYDPTFVERLDAQCTELAGTIDNLRMELADLQAQTEEHLATIRKLREENEQLVTRICALEATLEESL